ncbi:MAG TPA: CheR family methyltransferase [Nostocaceae cyanobacterium]|nr:CheR family methyltransferase [Nostocaceae cyanobacterium]
MEYTAIEVLIRNRIGLDINSIGSDAIARALKIRMDDCGVHNIIDYFQILQQSNQEWEALIDHVIIPETWFFREKESFKFLQKYVISEWLENKHKHQDKLRILSVPCATGEEPYSIAIALLEIGFNPTNVQIDAIDISQNCISSAKKAIYDPYSFRGTSLTFKERYFQPIENKYGLCSQVKNMVNFSQGNLAEPNFLIDSLSYDIVFCRNLLIYFDQKIKEQTIQVLSRLVKPEGMLFIGHGETGLLLHLNSQFISMRYPLAFAYRRVINATKKSNSKNPSFSARSHANSDRLIPSHKYHPPSGRKNLSTIKISQPVVNLLVTARNLADQGCFEQATKICQDYLKDHPISAEAYVLLGEMEQASGKYEQAAKYFHQALYLEPALESALTHLALIREYQGDFNTASILWQRIQRLHKKHEKSQQ